MESVSYTHLDVYKRQAGDNAVLIDAGKVTAEFAKSFAESEFEKYRPKEWKSLKKY